MNEQKDFLTVMEFSEKLRIHPNTVRSAIKKGRIQAFRVGLGSRSDYRIPTTEINRICEMDMMKLIEKIVDDKVENYTKFMNDSKKIIEQNREEKNG